ncbi:unnamed protein product [Caenorhabditis auriculariae]|uniref:beta-N-acetylhexosaminidase n=1 Tax=Caenorhabditis auriculariae TaxID=2777116 RepID=A0A8S1H3Y3_9PELO|nr:unnamed protein product [Caenorhabditis auriculariae]
MMRNFVCGRRARSSFQRLLYLCFLTCVFIFISSQFKNPHLDARVVPPAESDGKPIVLESPSVQQAPGKSVLAAPVQVSDRVQSDTLQKTIRNEPYPKLSSQGKFIPQRRIIHLDLKGAPYKPEFFPVLFSFFNRLQATGVLIEWEDMFPYTGKLASAVNGNAYNLSEVEFILQEAVRHHLQIIPLVQTFGHLEWILKLKEFAHLREDSRFPQVICFPEEEAWELITSMIDQVSEVHKKYGMEFFHMGADEAYQVGICNASVARLQKEQTKERLMIWHIARTASYIKEKHPDVNVMAWHDMMVNGMESDLVEYGLTKLIQPVVWNYAEDLDVYLPRSTWMTLRPFGRVWASSAWKGADGPARYCTNSMHYVRNHESWINQLTSVYQQFDYVEGQILAGWSRYDHLAILAELLPVALPTLSMAMETVLEGRPLQGSYPVTNDLLQCTIPTDLGFFVTGCRFPGSKIYELVNDLFQRKKQLRVYRSDDYELNGWLSRVADDYSLSSHWYIDKIQPLLEMYVEPIEHIERKLRDEMSKIYFEDAVEEFIFTHMGEELEWIAQKRTTIKKISEATSFPKRPMFAKKMGKNPMKVDCKLAGQQQ